MSASDGLLVSGATAEVGAILSVTGLAIAPVALAVVRRLAPPRKSVFLPRWGFGQVALVVLFAALLLAGVAFVGLPPAEEGPLADLVVTALVLGACAALVAVVAARRDPSGLRSLGLWQGGQLRSAVAGVVGYAMLLPAILGVGLLWPFLLESVGVRYETQLVLEAMRDLQPGERPFALLLGCGVMPLLEELLFRSFLQPLLVRRLSEVLGVLATSFVFAALHGTGAFLPIFVLSLLLGTLMLRTQRLLAVWSVHALHNGIMFLLLYR